MAKMHTALLPYSEDEEYWIGVPGDSAATLVPRIKSPLTPQEEFYH